MNDKPAAKPLINASKTVEANRTIAKCAAFLTFKKIRLLSCVTTKTARSSRHGCRERLERLSLTDAPKIPELSVEGNRLHIRRREAIGSPVRSVVRSESLNSITI